MRTHQTITRGLLLLIFTVLGTVASRAEFPAIKLAPLSEGELIGPVGIKNAGDGTDRLFIVDQRGLIQIIDGTGTLLATPFLDIEAKLVPQRANFDERGLLGLAFHPDFGNAGQPGEGKFYLYYSAPSPNAPGTAADPVDHMSVIAEYCVSAGDSNVADAVSERILLTFDQPQFNHDGGDVAFGPSDGLLYISTGDGGSSNDNNAGHTGGDGTRPSGVLGNSQDRTNLLGKILRIDPLGNDGPGGEFGIPAGNPFVGDGGGVREEIFAYGLRNPWRMCFDDGPGGTNRLFVADVGQGDIEEVNIVGIGDNLGWRNKEGTFDFDATAPGTGPFVDPVAQYVHPGDLIGGLPQIGLSVTGGCVYRGSQFPSLQGKYLFADWSNDFRTPNGTMLGLEETSPGTFALSILGVKGGNPIGKYITAFGKDEAGEIYVATRTVLPPEVDPTTLEPTGGIFRIVPGLKGRPDGLIREAGQERKGKNIYNLTGRRQTILLRKRSGDPFEYFFFVQNDGDLTDDILVKGTVGNRCFEVSYFQIGPGGRKNVTGDLIRGKLKLKNLEPGETRRFLAKVKTAGKVGRRSKLREFSFLSKSRNQPSKRDLVKAKLFSGR